MGKLELSGKGQTVLGLIDPEELGVTLYHEHLIVDLSCNLIPTTDESDKRMAYLPFTPDILWWHRYHNGQNLDDLVLLDEQVAIKEANYFKLSGGNSIVDAGNASMGRDAQALVRISKATGLNVIMGSGYYVAASHSPEMNIKTEEEITEEIIRDITLGADSSGIRSGVIGEIGCSEPLSSNERKSLRAAARAQQLTGAPLMIHPGFGFRESPPQIIRILDAVGADISHTVICHIENTLRDVKDRIALAKEGCYLAYDGFGREGGYRFRPRNNRVTDTPNDLQRTYEIIELIDKGYLNQILIAQDIANKNNLRAYGGWGYDHILRNVIPCMRVKGITEEQIHTIMVDNPKRLLTFA